MQEAKRSESGAQARREAGTPITDGRARGEGEVPSSGPRRRESPVPQAPLADAVAPVVAPHRTYSLEANQPLSELQESVLDEDQLRLLLADIATYGTVLEIAVKDSPGALPEAASRLPELYLKLIERRVFGAQLRYEFKGARWLDTLLTAPGGVRLVRIQLPR